MVQSAKVVEKVVQKNFALTNDQFQVEIFLDIPQERLRGKIWLHSLFFLTKDSEILKNPASVLLAFIAISVKK